jgi:2-succinyl-6-hydroxy-2,4-cyclohexadiene-1-carboxylate synthase
MSLPRGRYARQGGGLGQPRGRVCRCAGDFHALSWFSFAMPADLVLLHGFTQTGRSWQPVLHALAARYRALAPDLPGHGAFGERRPASFAACDAYLRVLADCGITLVGYSMGGRIALHAALSLGDRIERLVLIGASPGLADPAERGAREATDAALADRIETIGLEAFVREWGAQPLFAGMPRGIAEAAEADRLCNTAPGLAAALRGLGTGSMPPLWDRLGTLAMPVELLVGERDEKFRAIAERMAGALPRSRVHVVPGAGHAVAWEAPEAVADVLGRA